MNIDAVRELCLSFPGATEQITWGNDLTFRLAGKIFVNLALEPAPVWLSFKCSPESFAELTERPGIIPAPYLGRAKWVALETKDALPSNELAGLLRNSYDMVFAKLTKKARESLSMGNAPKRAGRSTVRKTKNSGQKHHAQGRRRRK
jgi:predicted DNA-binding protein (MmcQ/YjbR family)